MVNAPEILVAGHICLDIFPTFVEQTALREFRPGALYHVGPALRATGGAVANTGIALHRLGVNVALCGKVGDDLFGSDILRIVSAHGPHLAAGMKLSPGSVSSYTIVISPPGIDRTFLHCPGCNDTFTAADVNPELLKQARLMHFGYPPLMRAMYADHGAELARLLRRAKESGCATSLDMAFPDPQSPAGRIDWPRLLANVLPAVDVFTPSIEELLFMLDRPTWEQLMRKGRIDLATDIDLSLLRRLGDRLLSLGCALVMIKLGDQGAYLKSTRDAHRAADLGRLRLGDPWPATEALHPCFQVKVAGTTGSGDCTIAGLLAGLLRGYPLAQALRLAVAVGACSVEQADATSGVPTLAKVEARLAGNWPMRTSAWRL